MAEQRPGTGLFGWLGRQLGYVRKAVRTDVTREVVHRQQQVQEASLPEQPDVTLRRTIIDEVIVKKPQLRSAPPSPDAAPSGDADTPPRP